MLVLAADPIRERAESRLQAHEATSSAGHDRAHGLRIHVRRVDQVFLHVGRERVEVERAAHREGEHDEQCALVMQQSSSEPASLRCMLSAEAVSSSERRRYIATTAASAPMSEGDAPAPRLSSSGESVSCRTISTSSSEQLPADQRDVLEGRVEAAMASPATSLI